MKTESHLDESFYIISVAARLVELHPQTLRHYERLGLVVPRRSEGNIRLYAREDIERLHQIRRLTDELGVNPAGVGVILDMRDRMQRMQEEMEQMQAEFEAEVERLRRQLEEFCGRPVVSA
jgi:MerR family transcriptional regulator/heat shock protein HspR